MARPPSWCGRYGEQGDPLALRRSSSSRRWRSGRLFTIAANFTDPDAYFVGGGVVEAAAAVPRLVPRHGPRAHRAARGAGRVAEFALVPDLDMAGARGRRSRLWTTYARMTRPHRRCDADRVPPSPGYGSPSHVASRCSRAEARPAAPVVVVVEGDRPAAGGRCDAVEAEAGDEQPAGGRRAPRACRPRSPRSPAHQRHDVAGHHDQVERGSEVRARARSASTQRSEGLAHGPPPASRRRRRHRCSRSLARRAGSPPGRSRPGIEDGAPGAAMRLAQRRPRRARPRRVRRARRTAPRSPPRSRWPGCRSIGSTSR